MGNSSDVYQISTRPRIGNSKSKTPSSVSIVNDVNKDFDNVILTRQIDLKDKQHSKVTPYTITDNRHRQKLKWTQLLLDVIEKKSTTLNLNNLTRTEVDYIPWHLLSQCLSLTTLTLTSFPSNEKEYQCYMDYAEWYNKPPQQTKPEIQQLFPKQIFELKNLETLHVSGYPFSYVSPDLAKLTNLKTIVITGSPIICLPQEIGQLSKLEKIDFYCSRRMKYMPYETLHCKALKSTKMGTSRLYANYKTNLLLPPLPQPITNVMDRFKSLMIKHGFTDGLIQLLLDYLAVTTCSNEICKKRIYFRECIHYGWSRQRPGTDTVCLLAKMCSKQCINSILNGTRFYLKRISIKSETDGEEVSFENVNVDKDGKEMEKTLRRSTWKQNSVTELLNRFEYFWKYNLEINYASYTLIKGHNEEVMVVFGN